MKHAAAVSSCGRLAPSSKYCGLAAFLLEFLPEALALLQRILLLVQQAGAFLDLVPLLRQYPLLPGQLVTLLREQA